MTSIRRKEWFAKSAMAVSWRRNPIWSYNLHIVLFPVFVWISFGTMILQETGNRNSISHIKLFFLACHPSILILRRPWMIQSHRHQLWYKLVDFCLHAVSSGKKGHCVPSLAKARMSARWCLCLSPWVHSRQTSRVWAGSQVHSARLHVQASSTGWKSLCTRCFWFCSESVYSISKGFALSASTAVTCDGLWFGSLLDIFPTKLAHFP